MLYLLICLVWICRNSHPDVFCKENLTKSARKHLCWSLFFNTVVGLRTVLKKGVLKNLTKFTGKHLCQSLFFNKVGGFY